MNPIKQIKMNKEVFYLIVEEETSTYIKGEMVKFLHVNVGLGINVYETTGIKFRGHKKDFKVSEDVYIRSYLLHNRKESEISFYLNEICAKISLIYEKKSIFKWW